MQGKCILVCAGEFSPVEIEKTEEDILIAVDGGLAYLEQLGMLPDYIIGDFDSLSGAYRNTLEAFQNERPERVKKLPVMKDDTDTMAAARWGLEMGYRRFDLYGCTGGRLDHTMANIQTLVFLKKSGAKAYIFDERCMMFVIANETVDFHAGLTGTFSLFSLDQEITGVTETGLLYEIADATLSNAFPIGTSNHFIAEKAAHVTVSKGTALAIYTYQE